MKISEKEREVFSELAVRLKVAYTSYSLGIKSMNGQYNKLSDMRDNIEDYWIKLAIKVQDDISKEIESVFFDN